MLLADKLQVIEDKYMDLEQRISDPEVIARQQEWQKLTRQHASLTETVTTFREYKQVLAGIDEALEVLDDRSRDILYQRWLAEEKATLHDLAQKYNVSAERIRQLEKSAMNKLKLSIAA